MALETPEGTYSYRQLLRGAHAVAERLLDGRPDLAGARVALLAPPGFGYAAGLWATWRSGGVAVPMAVGHPPPELAFILDDADPVAVLAHPDFLAKIEPLARERGIRVLDSEVATRAAVDEGLDQVFRARREPEGLAHAPLPDVDPTRPALMVYTSGTTGRPKGVVTTHANVTAQIQALVDTWAWTESDRILLTLPLHHVHGIVNVLGCALWSGARCDMLPRFDAVQVWERFAAGGLTLFMAVPTIYGRLIEAWEAADEPTRSRWSKGARSLRLMVSGSAALPVRFLERWSEITGHTLLERYGMTEIGMGLGNPLGGPRRPGHVGVPFPGVEIRLVREDGSLAPEGQPGEVQIRGPSVFREYWRRPVETAAAFVDGWFKTGDIGLLNEGSYRLLGRNSVDIIKTGGEKVSALEVEEVLREHPTVADLAVVGVPDAAWGERVCALVVPQAGTSPDGDALRSWARTRLAPYKVPSRVLFAEALPRNAMGKVTKPAVRDLFESSDPGGVESPSRSSDSGNP